ncbi:feruloyl CoA ortho-hydroxylase 1-like [Melia azedarach]|uniref:Feruloyl CoA ortho-hydroxylase 1-like n=1 Tax=Melia azedarach TaxID=155640 RepID=A0ACC1YNS6_MELAZ|nr:feruloyl CoA ortho-hydroxylase 1-like [Melia azedarach]
MASTIHNSLDVTDFVVTKGNGVKGLVNLGIQQVPEKYIQPPEERFDLSKVVSDESIPVIDVSTWNDPEVFNSICEAASKWGFFQIVNHGIPLQVMEDLKNAAHGFYELPNEERRKYSKGFSPSDTVLLTTSFSPRNEVALEWTDYLRFSYVSGNDQASALWPSVCKDQLLEYMKRAEATIEKLLQVLLQGLNVKEFDKVKRYALMGSRRIHLNYYPKCPNPELAAGAGPHSDISINYCPSSG